MHKCNPNESKQYHGSGKLLRMAIEKYGEENFSTQIIEICDSREELAEAEKYWIKYYNAVESDEFYNISAGGDGGNIIAGYDEKRLNEYKELRSSIAKGENNPSAILTESDIYDIIRLLLNGEHDDEIAQVYGVRPSTINTIRYHKTWTDYTDGYVFPKLKSKKYESQRKPVIQYDKSGNIIGSYKSMVEAENNTGIPRKLISAVCRGRNKNAYGYVWRYTNEPFDKYDIYNKKIGLLEQYDKNGNYIRSFETVKEACEHLSTGTSMASKMTKIGRNVPRGCTDLHECYGCLWRYNKE